MVKSINTLKGYFNTGDRPDQTQFWDLIDSIHGFRSMEDLESSNEAFAEGDVIYAEDMRFRVAPQDASDHDLTLASGVKLYDAPLKSYGDWMMTAAPVVSSAGVLSGALTVGSALTVTGAAWAGAGVSVSYQWTRSGINIPGAVHKAYVPQVADAGKMVARRVTVANAQKTVTDTTPEVKIGLAGKKVRFNPLETHEGVTLVDGTTASMTANKSYSANAAKYVGAGKFYFEVQVAGPLAQAAFIGVAAPGASLNHGPGPNKSYEFATFMLRSGGVSTPAGGGPELAVGWGASDTVRVAVDMDDRRVYFGNSTGWTGDPVAGTGGFPLPEGELTAHVCPQSSGNATYILLSQAGEFIAEPPVGFASYGEVESSFESKAAPTPADELVDTIGVCTHINYRDEFWGDPAWRQPTVDLGVRYVRSMLGQNEDATADFLWLNERAGIKILLRVPVTGKDELVEPIFKDDPTKANIDYIVSTIGSEKVVGIEGPNEPNGGRATEGWEIRTRAAQKLVYEYVRSIPELDDIPVIGPSIFNRDESDYALLGDISSIADNPNLHYYTGGRAPSMSYTRDTGQKSMTAIMEDAMAICPGEPLWVTEYGQRTQDDDTTLTNDGAVQKVVAAKYLLRGIMEFFNRGVEKVFLYLLADDFGATNRFGLLLKTDKEHLVRRPAYYSVQRLISLMADPGADFKPKPLRYNLTGNLSRINHHMFQKSDGTYYLVIWQDLVSWDKAAVSVVDIPERAIKLGLGREAASVKRWLPTIADGATEIASDAYEADLMVPDHLAIFQITTKS